MNVIARILFTFSLLLLGSCASVLVNQDFDQDFDFRTLSTYQWLAEQHQIEPTAANLAKEEPFLSKRIHRAIENSLQRSGYKTSEASPNFYVTYHSEIKTKIKSRPTTITLGTGYYGHHGGISFSGGSEIYQYDERKLTIDILDHQRQIVWRGTSASTVRRHTSPQKVTELISQTINKILKQFPPK